jgi:hypothetical protein
MTLARIEDLFGGHLPAPIELLSQAVAPHMRGAPVARITVIR